MVSVVFFLSFILPLALAACTANHPYVGFNGNLKTHADGVQGVVSVMDDCTILVTRFTITGAPAVYFRGATGSSRQEQLNGFRLSNTKISGVYNGNGAFTIDLGETGRSLNDFSVFIVWCEDFNANLGDITLGPGNNNPGPPSPFPANCIPLVDNKFNLHWQIREDQTVQYTLEAVLPSVTSWMGFGIADPALQSTGMVGADITVAGFFRAQPFALDYKITQRSQCDYSSTRTVGVCPDPGNNSQVTLLSGTIVNGVTSVSFVRPLNSTDTQYDYSIDPNVDMWGVWAFGPYQDTSSEPIVLAHSGVDHATSFSIKLNQTINMCPTLVAPTPSDGSNTPTVPVIKGETTFEAYVLPDNGFYPNPPSWGVSWTLNGKATPVLKVDPGVELTFIIKGTDQHPFYITSSLVGGHSSAAEVIYAGGPESYGTEENPYILKWTPPGDVPVVYYQCYTHQKLGWKIEIGFANHLGVGVALILSLMLLI